MKIAVKVNLQVTGLVSSFWKDKKWEVHLICTSTLSGNEVPRVGEFLKMNIFHGYVDVDEIIFASIQFLKVKAVHRVLKDGVLHPHVMCTDNPDYPIHLKNLPEEQGREWIEKSVIPRFQELGFAEILVK